MSISDELREWADVHCGEECEEYLGMLADRIDRELVELPVDKDGVPIHVGDTVYLEDCSKTIVHSIDLMADATNIVCWVRNRGYVPLNQSDFTHTRPDSLERIANELNEWRVAAAGDCRINATDEDIVHDLAERIRKLAAKDGK